MNLKFKIAVIESELKFYEVAKLMDWTPSRASAVVSEIYIPTEEEKEALAEILSKSVFDLFPPCFVNLSLKDTTPHPEAL